METVYATVRLAGIAMPAIFAVIFLFYVTIRLMMRLFPR